MIHIKTRGGKKKIDALKYCDISFDNTVLIFYSTDYFCVVCCDSFPRVKLFFCICNIPANTALLKTSIITTIISITVMTRGSGDDSCGEIEVWVSAVEHQM